MQKERLNRAGVLLGTLVLAACGEVTTFDPRHAVVVAVRRS